MVNKFFLFAFLLAGPSVYAQSNPQSSLRDKAIKAFQAKDYASAASSFYLLVKQTRDASARQEAKYFLGVSLSKLDLAQTASFPLVEVVRLGSGKFRRPALNHLAVLAMKMSESSLLKYSISQLTPEELTELSKSSYYLSLSEIADGNGDIDKALAFAQQSFAAHPKNEEALYQIGLLSLAKGDQKQALASFSQLLEVHGKKDVIDKKRGLLLMNIARTFYQMREWDKAASFYRQLPKDHFYYRISLKELSWTLFRNGQLRSALSPLQSLTTPFYSQFFDPESLLLSSMIYFFSCHYDEAIKVIDVFEKNYLPTFGQMDVWLRGQRTADDFYNELVKAQLALDRLRKMGKVEAGGVIPFFVFRSIIEEADVQAHLKHLKRLELEGKKAKKIFSVNDPLLIYIQKVLKGRTLFAKKGLAADVKVHITAYWKSAADMIDRFSFLKYEVLNGQRQTLKENLAGGRQAVDQELSRSYYVQNGYRYWPFQGEYWRDEIGSYQYVGVDLCQK